MDETPSTLIAIAVVEHEDRLLVGRRPAGVPLSGYCEFPGGKVKPNESSREAAVRECLEETGLSVIVTGEYPTRTHQYDHGTVELHFFQCFMRNADERPRAPFHWIARDQLADYRFPEANHSLIQQLIAK